MIRPKKHLGQHFLKDENIALKIIGSLSPRAENVLEIGPGTGILTKHLLQHEFNKFLAIEIDPESVEFLKSMYPESAGKIIHADFLKFDFGSLFTGKISIIGNFPYNISSQILFRVLEQRQRVGEVVGMFQKEVAERISSPPGSRKYGILSVLIQAYFNIGYLFTLNEGTFYPPPKVKSAVIKLSRNNIEKLDCDEHLFINMVKSAFNQRRKTLRNSLSKYSFINDDDIDLLLTKRAEQLSVSDFVFLTQKVKDNS
jgi:16S rRNA (adenine1518-N6/adenine1519-N6)-dimethyltransferase